MAKHSKRHLFLVAGYPASGKSTLLGHAARGQTEVFGDDYDPIFRSAVPATKLDEQLKTTDKLENGLWFTLADLEELEQLDELPQNLAFHLDLLLLLLAVIRPSDSSELNQRSVSAAFRGLLDRELFAAFPEIVACTLVPAFAQVQRNWKDRIEQGMQLDGYLLSTKNDLILNIPDPQAVYEGICHEWAKAVSTKARQHRVMQWQPDDGNRSILSAGA